MPKELFKISNFRLKNVYGLPTIYGIVLSVLLGFALWFSIFNNSNTERLIFVFMLFLFVINLLETSYPFRWIEVNALFLDPPFSRDETRLDFEIKNRSNVRSQTIWIRLNKDKEWIGIDPVDAHSSQKATLRFTFQKPGVQTVPSVRIKTYADSSLYRFWRNIDAKKEIIVLPQPIDHQIAASLKPANTPDHELNDLEEIHDPARFKFTDPKLFQKTNRRYQRIFRSRQNSTQISYDWAELKGLSPEQKGEQFSFWLKSMASMKNKQNIDINVHTPFIEVHSTAQGVDLRSIKLTFAKWFYAQV